MWNIILGPVLEIIDKVVDKLVPDLAARDKIKLEMMQELQKQDFSLLQAQLDINKEEAKHDSVFVAGWRPAAAWVCVTALAWQFVAVPIAQFVLTVCDIHTAPLPQLDYAQLSPILLGMLGLSISRSYEKVKGETTNAIRVGS